MVQDEYLFEKAKDGDMEAFEMFIIKYEKLIYNYSYRMITNSSDAEDISQEVLIKVYKNIKRCQSFASFKSWLYRIINNTCIDEIRKRKNKTTISLDKTYDNDEGTMENQLASDDYTPERAYIQNETSMEVQQVINKLSPDYKSVLIMRDINGLSYDEISESLDINIGTVKSRISRARTSFKKIMENEMEH